MSTAFLYGGVSRKYKQSAARTPAQSDKPVIPGRATQPVRHQWSFWPTAEDQCTGLTVIAELDTGSYPKGIKVTDEQMKTTERHALRRRPAGIAPLR
jgi:hypothetical protein